MTKHKEKPDNTAVSGSDFTESHKAGKRAREVEASTKRGLGDFSTASHASSPAADPGAAQRFRDAEGVATWRWLLYRLYFHMQVVITGSSPNGTPYGWGDRLARLTISIIAVLTTMQAVKISLVLAGVDSGPLYELRMLVGGAVHDAVSLGGELIAALFANDVLALVLGVTLLLILTRMEV